MTPRPSRSPLFPYTTLFRSLEAARPGGGLRRISLQRAQSPRDRWRRRGLKRSEEHTSELQAHFHPVSRLRLEKKPIMHVLHGQSSPTQHGTSKVVRIVARST